MNCINQHHGEGFSLINGDACEVASVLPSNSLDFLIYSPPFSSLYIYSDSLRDMGNCANDAEFFEHYSFLTKELLRATRPGRLCAVHCKDLVDYKGSSGRAGLRDFPGALVQAHEAAGWKYHSRVTIWKDPVTEMQRTKAHGLLHKQLCSDSSFSRQGLPDYLLLFRKWATEEDEHLVRPVRGLDEGHRFDVSHQRYIGTEPPLAKDARDYSISVWQKYASPVWFDIDMMRVLNIQQARSNEDEKHLCLARGSLVLTYDGYRPIENLTIGELVLTHEGRWRPITAKVCTGRKETIKVEAQGVADLRLTADHEIYLRKGDKYHPRQTMQKVKPEWVQAQNSLSHYVNLKLPPVRESELNSLEWWIIGRWLADGHKGTRGNFIISVGNHKLAYFLEKVGDHAGVQSHHTATQVVLKGLRPQVVTMLQRCGQGAAHKVVPGEALELNPELAASLFDGYLSGDGHQDKLGRFHATSVSRALLLGLALVAQRATGCVASVYAGRKAGKTTIEGREVNTQNEWIMLLSQRNGSGILLEDGAWKKVRKITEVGEDEVWDISVAEDSSFTAEGCIVHNCPLQLDVIERAVQLWSNPGDTVFTPFGGIGSELVGAMRQGRRALGIELKPEYFNVAVRNCEAEVAAKAQGSLFDTPEPLEMAA